MKISSILRIAFGLACAAPLLSIACGGNPPQPATPTAPSASTPDTSMPSGSAAPTESSATAGSAAPSASAAAPSTWKDMNHAQRMDFMKKTVFPKMKDEFTAFDGKRFADMNCKTCHGDGASDGSFSMPNAKLPVVPSKPDDFKKMTTKKPEISKFMMEKVVPDMASMLGEQPFDMKTGQGFGCHNCHTDGSKK